MNALVFIHISSEPVKHTKKEEGRGWALHGEWTVIAYISGSSEGDFINIHMAGDSSASSSTIARYYVHHTSRDASLLIEYAYYFSFR